MKLALVQATIRRDAFTTTATTVPEHELKIVRAVFGRENVKAGGVVGEREFDPDAEYDRLCQKYGDEKTIAIYGEPENNKLADEMKPKKPAKNGGRGATADDAGSDGADGAGDTETKE